MTFDAPPYQAVPGGNQAPRPQNVAAALHNLQAEQALLGGLLCDTSLLPSLDLHAGQFADPVHGLIFTAVRELFEARRFVDPMSVAERLRGQGGLEDIGGAQYLMLLLENAAHLSSQVREYAELVRALAMRRELRRIGLEASHMAQLGDGMVGAVDALIAGAESELRALAQLGGAQVAWIAAHDAARDAVAEAKAGKMIGPPCGLIDLDELTNGLMPGSLHILAGRPSMGKTAVGLQMAFGCVEEGAKRAARDEGLEAGVLFVTQEMTAKQLGIRLAVAAADDGVLYATGPACGSVIDALRGRLSEAQWARIDAALTRIRDLPLVLDERAPLTPAKIAAACGRQIDRWRREKRVQPTLVVVDYLGLIEPDRDRRGNKVLEIGDVSAALKALAKNLGVHVLALCQLNRGVESRDEKRPLLSDLRDSGSIEQDADIVTFVYRDAYYLERELHAANEAANKDASRIEAADVVRARLAKCRTEVELIVAKQRQGAPGVAKVFFNPATTAVRNLGRGA